MRTVRKNIGGIVTSVVIFATTVASVSAVSALPNIEPKTDFANNYIPQVQTATARTQTQCYTSPTSDGWLNYAMYEWQRVKFYNTLSSASPNWLYVRNNEAWFNSNQQTTKNILYNPYSALSPIQGQPSADGYIPLLGLKSPLVPDFVSKVYIGYQDDWTYAVGVPSIVRWQMAAQLQHNIWRRPVRPVAGSQNTNQYLEYLDGRTGGKPGSLTYDSLLTNPSYPVDDRGRYQCTNVYIARCGDGVRDDVDQPGSATVDGKQGMQTSVGFLSWLYPITNQINEQCDWGTANGTNEVRNGQTCTATCQLQTVVTNPSVTIDKSGPATAEPGDTISYTINFTNDGDTTLNNVRIEDTLPAGVTYVSETFGGVVQSRNSIVIAGTRRSVGPLTLQPGETGRWTIFAQVDADAPAGTITNTARVTADGGLSAQDTVDTLIDVPDPEPVTCTVSAPVTVIAGTPMDVTCTATQAGNTDDFDHTINIDPNNRFAQSRIGGVGVFSVTPTPTETQVGTNTIRCTVTGDAGQTATCQDTVVVDPAPQSDISITKTGPEYAAPGDTISYTITVTNDGDATDSDVDLIDDLPTGVTYVSSTNTFGVTPQQLSNGDWSLNNLTLAPGATGMWTITAVLADDVAGNLDNTVRTNGGETDTWRTIAPTCTITPERVQIEPGQSQQVTVTANIYDVPDDYGPTRVLFIDSDNPGANADRTPGANGIWTDTFTVTGPRTYEVSIQHNPSNIGGEREVLANCAGEVVLVGDADLTLNKSVVGGQVGGYRSGDLVAFQIDYANVGVMPASGVVLTDLWDDSIAFLTSSVALTQNVQGDYIYDIGDLEAGESGSIVITGRVDGTADFVNGFPTMTNSVSLTSTNTPGVIDSVTIRGIQPDMYVVKELTGLSGDIVSYSLTFGNSWWLASGVVLEDLVPDGMTITSGTLDTALVADPASWDIATNVVTFTQMPEGSTGVVYLTGRLSPSIELYRNIAVIRYFTDGDYPYPDGAYQPDSDPSNNVSIDLLDLRAPRVQISKTTDVSSVAVGDTLRMTLRYENFGAATGFDVMVRDTMPPSLQYIQTLAGTGVQPVDLTPTIRPPVYEREIGTMSPGSFGEIVIEARVIQP